jgi:hypothetical protein
MQAAKLSIHLIVVDAINQLPEMLLGHPSSCMYFLPWISCAPPPPLSAATAAAAAAKGSHSVTRLNAVPQGSSPMTLG